MRVVLLMILILLKLLPCISYAQTKVASYIPDSYKVDLKKVATKSNKGEKNKENRVNLRKAKSDLKKEIRLKAKIYKLKTDSLTKITKILKDPANKKRLSEHLDKMKGRVANVKEIKELDEKYKISENTSKYSKEGKDALKLIKRDSGSLELVKEKFSGHVKNEEIKEVINTIDIAQLHPDSILNNDPPSFIMKQFDKEFAELDKLKAFEKELKGMPQMLKPKEKDIESLKGQDFMKEMQLQKEIGKHVDKRYVDLFEQNKDKLEKGRKAIQVAKKKNGLKNILKEFAKQDVEKVKSKTFKERLYIGGFIEINRTSPLVLDANPTFGYRFTDKITFGLGGQYRLLIGKDDNNSSQKPVTNASAYQTFIDYKLSSSFFLHTEYEYHIQQIPEIGKKVNNNYYLGIGKDLNFRNQLKASIVLLYNFNSDSSNSITSNSLNDRISVRFGFKFN